MIDIKKDGGPAFPFNKPDENRAGFESEILAAKHFGGMTLRDWFAGMALCGLATNQEILLRNTEMIEHFGTNGIDNLQANKAYRLADAMIAAREK
jgi:hypothetical protein